MDGQLPEQATHRVAAKIDVGQIRITADRQRWVVGGGKPKAGLIQPVADKGFQMLSATDAPHVFLRRQRGMPREYLEAVKPAVFHHQEPSLVAKRIKAANAAGRAFCDWVIHQLPHVANNRWPQRA